MTGARLPEPWDRQPGLDCDDSFQCFRFYLTLPPIRRLTVVAAAFPHVSYGTIIRWANEHLWRERAAKWDSDLAEQLTAEAQKQWREDVKTIASNHLAILRQTREIVQREVAKMLRESSENPGAIMKPHQLIRLLTEQVKLSQLLSGQPTEIVQGLDLSKLTDAELEEADRLARLASGADETAEETDTRH